MPVNDAKRFLKSITGNPELMKNLNQCQSPGEIQTLLGENGFKFDSAEFVEAWTREVANSQTEEYHHQFNELRMWWEMLNRF